MSIVKIFGPGCAKCKKVEETVRKVVAETGADARVEKVSDMQEILALGILATPAVTVDGIVKSAGRLPEPGEVKQWLGK
jgi:small redox-active disulfide protein 2